ncbi:MAG TPA: sigma-54 dependent transcriptional regulator [Terriglobales bacterium]|jgi:two-component system response regulator HydG|nr:sigma-54 dependent transcriptional regulator [Terriglobales bacterium]
MPTVEVSPVSRRQIAGAELLSLLVIDDEKAVRESCRDAAQINGFNTLIAESAEQAYKILDSQTIDIVLLDLRLPGASGLEALREVRKRRPDAIIIVITGYATVASAVQAMKQGAFDYITKPFTLEELRVLLERATDELKKMSQKRVLRDDMRSKQGFGSLVGKAPEMERLYRIISKAAQSSHPVLIMGESGTGKELVARSIHYSGPNRDKPFIPVDCGSLVPTLIESELFGYVRGAFTGAVRSKEGLLQIANGGTVFLDEIGELPIDLQAKLLRAIQEHEIRPVGSTKRIPIDVRILAATNRDLETEVAEGNFRRDLYFRLNVLTLRIPPLRERKQDIPQLLEHFLDRLSRANGTRKVISDEALKALINYDWPGNVRELENCIERTWALSSGPTMAFPDLPTYIKNTHQQKVTAEPVGPKIIPLVDLERKAILEAIEQLRGDKLLAAKMLGIGKTTLYRKLKEYAQI